ncbi:tRNA uridine(34) 5-carboxymethylaminomethyl modification radical SAM/GNAT enzyme Elp3 [Candidatus Peregrinibacteria bacterium]|nr:tRNA uridine(34) 5-carboxymethylaminomethyl modification radical SAM/GNAT enzyme Elp3 [Candidatus Peregrinibacteria bacterium]
MNNILKKLVSQAINKFAANAVKNKIFDEKSLNRLKNDFCKKYKITSPKNTDLIEAYRELIKRRAIKPNEKFFELIKKRKVRSLSGIASITVITKDYPCPGKCIFCPKEKGMPKSYLSNEPAIMRAILNKFDPFGQTRTRLTSLKKTGHPISKIEMIIAGGTFSYYPRKYTTEFVKRIYDALNYPKKSRNLISAQKINETAVHRCIGLSIETRPDFINEKEIKYLRELGVTKVELGVQTTYDDVLKFNKRGHTVATSVKAIQMLKDAGFKVNCHIMPGLPGSSAARDIKMFKELFSNPDFQPDWLKIYPCVVVPGSALENIWRNKKFKPYTDKQMISLLAKIKPIIPEYVRVTRLYRDIPSNSILAGPKI